LDILQTEYELIFEPTFSIQILPRNKDDTTILEKGEYSLRAIKEIVVDHHMEMEKTWIDFRGGSGYGLIE
jgi:hypothetical protein